MLYQDTGDEYGHVGIYYKGMVVQNSRYTNDTPGKAGGYLGAMKVEDYIKAYPTKVGRMKELGGKLDAPAAPKPSGSTAPGSTFTFKPPTISGIRRGLTQVTPGDQFYIRTPGNSNTFDVMNEGQGRAYVQNLYTQMKRDVIGFNKATPAQQQELVKLQLQAMGGGGVSFARIVTSVIPARR